MQGLQDGPGTSPALLQGLQDKVEVIFSVFSGDLEQGRIRGDFGITYDMATLKALDDADHDLGELRRSLEDPADEWVPRRP